AGCGSFPCVGASANMVFGQGGSPTSSGCNSDTEGGNPTANDLCYPYSVAVDAAGNLYVADNSNNRVLEYNAPLTNGANANLVLGQSGIFSSSGCNSDTEGGNPTANDLCYPYSVAVDAAGNLYVADNSNNRVLEYNAPLTNGANANLVLGQGGIFTSTGCNSDTDGSNPTANDLCEPSGVAVGASGDLYVADNGNSRVLEYSTPLTNGASANMVFGQGGSPTSSGCNSDTEGGNPTANDLCYPYSVAVDAAGNLYVADNSNNRVLEYNAPLTNGATANLVLGQGGIFTSTGCNSDTDGSNPTANDLCEPSGVALDASGDLYVADNGNSRVLEYSTPLTNGASANMVFGQGGSPTSNGCNSDTEGGNPTANDLCYPYGVAVDAAGNLYVADTSNNRVLEYNAPLTNGATANLVFGQGDSFTSSDCNFGGTSASPESL